MRMAAALAPPGLAYVAGVTSLELDRSKCNGCRRCIEVCPHAVFEGPAKEAVEIVRRDACMECGACVLNCSEGALTVHPGVGCAVAILRSWMTRSEPGCACSG